MKTQQLLFVFLPFFLYKFLRGVVSTETEEFHSISLLHDNGRLREATSLGYSDIFFDLPNYLKNVKDFSEYAPVFKQIPISMGRIQKYADFLIRKNQTKSQLIQIIGMINQTFSNDDSKVNLPLMIGEFDGEVFKQPVKGAANTYKGLFVTLLEIFKKNRNTEACVYHFSGREVLTVLAFAQMLAGFKLKQKTPYELIPGFDRFVNNLDFTLKAVPINGTRDSFACTPTNEYRRKKQHLLLEQVMNSTTKVYLGKIEAGEGKLVLNDCNRQKSYVFFYHSVITGVRFRIFDNILFVQIKERKLLPFGFTATPTIPDNTPGWKSLPATKPDDLKQIRAGCEFLLDRHWLGPTEVLVGVQLKMFEEEGRCLIGVIAYGRKVDLITAEFHNYTREYFKYRYGSHLIIFILLLFKCILYL